MSTVAFRAGTESRLGNLGLWLASWLVRWRLIKSLAPAGRAFGALHRMTALWGGIVAGMVVRLLGVRNGKRVERRWSLIASGGDGPEIPTLAAAALVERIATGSIEPGARDAGGSLTLADFDPYFRKLAVRTTITETPCRPPLYERVMVAEFAALAPAVREMHEVLGDKGASGRAIVTGGQSVAARTIRRLVGFPPPGDYDVHVHFEERREGERWTRDFEGHRFSSRLRAGPDSTIVEQFGPLHFHFRLACDADGALSMRLVR